MDVEVPPLVSTNMPAPLISRKIDEDEEYDDDEDDYGNDGDGDVNMTGESTRQPEKAVVLGHLVACEHRANGTLPDGVGRVTSQQQKQHLSSLAEPVDLGKSGDKHANSGTPTMLNVALHAVFHTLEDLPSVVRDQDLYEDSVRQIKGVMQQRAAEPKDMLVSKIGSMQNMKNLAQFIDNHRDSVNMSTRELSHLLSEVRPKRTKWANERRVGQVELYDALENVLSELKNMGDVSAPFLSQVKRKDAPDYYKVIKHPMDLSAMAKNLRNEMYNSKRQFTDHLQLIRDNCYTYNTEPGNYYRKSVDTMLAKARQLMDAVPDIVVRDKSNGGGDDAQTECGDESGNESQSARMMYGQREGSVLADEGTPAPGTADYNSLQSSTSMMRASSDCLGVFESTSANTSQQLPLPLQHQQPSQPKLTALALNIQRVTGTGATAHIAISDLAEGYDLPLGEKIWRSRTRKRISAYHRQLEQDAAASALNTQRALVRTAENMRAFANSTHDAREAVSVQDVQAIEHGADVSDLRTIFVPVAGTSEAGEARRRNEELDWERKEWLRAAEELDSHGWPFVSECEPVAGLPQLETLEEQAGRSGVLQWLNDDCEATVDAVLQGSAAYDGSSGGSGDAMHAQPSIDAYATARFPDNEMWRAMADNVDCLRNIRAIDSKIWASRLNIPVGMLQPEAPEEKSRGTRGQHSADEQGHMLTRDMHSSYAMRPDPPAPFSLDAP
ncbi:Transcriptional activator spt7, partial [Coemansia sp. RSA 2320]